MAKDKQDFNNKLREYSDLNSVIKSGMPNSTESERRALHAKNEALREDILSTPRRAVNPSRKIISLPPGRSKKRK